jgi:hypothetical protein
VSNPIVAREGQRRKRLAVGTGSYKRQNPNSGRIDAEFSKHTRTASAIVAIERIHCLRKCEQHNGIRVLRRCEGRHWKPLPLVTGKRDDRIGLRYRHRYD